MTAVPASGGKDLPEGQVQANKWHMSCKTGWVAFANQDKHGAP